MCTTYHLVAPTGVDRLAGFLWNGSLRNLCPDYP